MNFSFTFLLRFLPRLSERNFREEEFSRICIAKGLFVESMSFENSVDVVRRAITDTIAERIKQRLLPMNSLVKFCRNSATIRAAFATFLDLGWRCLRAEGCAASSSTARTFTTSTRTKGNPWTRSITSTGTAILLRITPAVTVDHNSASFFEKKREMMTKLCSHAIQN